MRNELGLAQLEESPGCPLSPTDHDVEPEQYLHDDDEEESASLLVLTPGYENARKTALAIFGRIETAFLRLAQRDMKAIESEANTIRKGTHPNLSTLLGEIEDRHKERMQDLASHQKFQLALIRKQRQIALEQLKADLQIAKRNIRLDFVSQAVEKKRKIDIEHYSQHRSAPDDDSPDRDSQTLAPIFNKRQALQDREEFRIVGIYGFPSASVFGVEEEELEDDLIAMGLLPAYTKPQEVSCTATPVGEPTPASALPPAPKSIVTSNSTPTPSLSMSSPNTSSVLPDPPIPFQPVVDTTPSAIVRPPQPPTKPLASLEKPMTSVSILDGKINVGNYAFGKSDVVSLTDSGINFTVKILNIGPSDLIVQRKDGSKTTLSFDLLRNGRVTLIPKQ
ncbi:hypothetical protein HDU91_000176 [Kappamyces sp. JEL0680]|nr:hypothetical protein HDU91_000176 [Kappamyces sp. JEL0680]